ncbi:ATP-binding cassette domain-containing protein [Gordonia shandongensis]|uniref:ATP-binding cassette domain-containing protein n=1 Tax=Gordonia shandongensis TaxID=376351 RepID=UPI0004264128|nr:ABC transporter ATP-binding protein [Gordonia shandongensis]
MTTTTVAARTALSARGLTKRYGTELALDEVTFDIPEHAICGLFGRNGAGKTTLMSILTAQNFATSGHGFTYGESAYENPRVLSRMCFVREGQTYPEDSVPAHAFQMARLFFPRWDQDLADELVDEFRLPVGTRIKKLSRGQLSAVGVIIGLASRAEITFFDEPYLGLDAVARQSFYDRLIEDYTAHPRTILLSSHLIDEVSDLIERVLVLDAGRLVLDATADDLRGTAFTVVGPESRVDAVIGDREELHRERLGSVASATVLGTLSDADQAALTAAGLSTAPVALQELIVRLTRRAADRPAGTPKGAQR